MRTIFRIATVLAMLGSLPAAANGNLDPTFGDGGRVFANINYFGVAAYPFGVGSGSAFALQPDGRVLVAGYGVGNSIARVNPGDGTLDLSFNGMGRVFFNQGWSGGPKAMAVQPDGGILVLGLNGTQLGVLRFSASGVRDAAFNAGTSLLTVELRTPQDGTHNLRTTIEAVLPRADGRVDLVASTEDIGLRKTSYRLRLTAGGALDTTFNGTGRATLPIAADTAALQSGGLLLLAGANNGAPGVMRLADDDSPDPAFNGGALVPLPANAATAMAVQADGRIVIAGNAIGSANLAFARLNGDGSLDASFNGTGSRVQPVPTGSGAIQNLGVDSAGRVVAAGVNPNSGFMAAIFVLRLDAAGNLDTSFNGTGFRSFSLSTGYMLTTYPYLGTAVEPDGAIIECQAGGPWTYCTRMLPNGSNDAAFGNAGVASVPVTPGTVDTALGVAVQPDGKILALGRATGFLGSALDTVSSIHRYNADGTRDTGYQVDIVNPSFTVGCSPPCTSFGNALALLADGRAVAAGGDWRQAHDGSQKILSGFYLWRVGSQGAIDASWSATFDDFSTARAVIQQADGKIVAAGDTYRYASVSPSFPASPSRFAVARFNLDTTPDGTFGSNGLVSFSIGSSDSGANAVAQQSDGRLVLAGYSVGNGRDFTAVRLDASGSLASVFTADFGGSEDTAYALAIQPDNRIVMAGAAGANGALVRFTFEGGLDAGFGAGGKVVVSGGPIRSIALQPDGKIVAVNEAFDVMRFLPNGSLDASFGIGGRLSVPMGGNAMATALAIQPNGRYVLAGAGGPNADSDIALARVDPFASSLLGVSPQPIDFGGVSLFTTSSELSATVTNNTNAPLAVTGADSPAPFTKILDCVTTLAPGASCTLSWTFSPTVAGLATADATLGTGAGPVKIALRGTGERSLVTHYYLSLLNRAPDSSGKAYWEGEAVRMQGLGANINETWRAMAMAFVSSAEYQGLGHDDAAFVTDLYLTFFNRAPDGPGGSYWVGQLQSGLPREVALAAFMFSTEFGAFTQGIFGNTTARAEVDVVVDFYRGILGRLPETAGLQSWVAQFRTAQCQGGAAVYAQAEEISSSFTQSTESFQRHRSNAQFVGDMYNAFLRRGGDLGGVAYWIDQLATGARSREQVRQAFLGSAEFAGRVNAVISQGCMP